ncbi:MAG: TolC family protein, partial [Flavobacterium sp.]|nr:TolC family protein [Flavobacterium sp.]
MGLKNNLNIQAVTLETKMQSQLVKTAFELPKTEISGTFGQINSQAQDKNFQISQSFNPFQISAKRKLLQENSSASLNKLSVSKQEITFSIRQSWNTILYFEK